MMIRKLFFWGVLLGAVACQSLETPEKPENFITEEQMVTILTDIAFVKAAKSSFKKNFDKHKINPEKYILEKYEIDSLVFAENNRWYVSQMDTYKKVFDKVKQNLKASKDTYEKLKKQEDSLKRVEDSIAKAKIKLAKEDTLSVAKEEKKTITAAEKLQSISDKLTKNAAARKKKPSRQ